MEKEKTHELTKINKIIAIMSGKGGVGKSSVTSLCATALASKGYTVGILDADITGPSIPKIFGINKERCIAVDEAMYPVVTATGIKVMSLNLMIDDESSPVVWRGPLIAGTVKQFYTDVVWGELDYLLIDLPPGTGDVPLTIMQSIPVDGIIIVTTPQDLVQMIVKKSIKMANMLGVSVLGVVENMSYLNCPHCNEKISIFGNSNAEEKLKELNVSIIEKLPIDVEFTKLCDEGKVEIYTRLNPEAAKGILNSIE